MARPAAVTPDQIRTTVLAMLAEADDPVPASDLRLRRIVSVRKLRARPGAHRTGRRARNGRPTPRRKQPRSPRWWSNSDRRWRW